MKRVEPPVAQVQKPLPVDIDEQRETAKSDEFWSFSARLAVVGIFLIMFGALLIYARAVVLPVVTAVVIGSMFAPLERRARDYKIPAWLFALVVVGALMGLFQTAAALLSGSILDWIERAPEITEALKAKLVILDGPLSAFRNLESAITQDSKAPGDPLLRLDIATLVPAALGYLTPAMGEILVFFATLFFFLFSRSNLRRNLILVFEEQDTRLKVIRIINDIEANLTRYLGTVTLINAGLGLLTGIGAWLLGLPNPTLIGALAFACNYVPYIGPAFLVLVLFGIGLIHYPLLGQAIIPPVLFVVVTTIEGQIITPNIVGQRLTLNPFAVFLGLTVWTWIWGPVGAFLSVPFLIVGLVVVNHLEVKRDVELPG